MNTFWLGVIVGTLATWAYLTALSVKFGWWKR